MTDSTINTLTRGRLLARNSALNLIGPVVPILVALFVIPLIIKRLGTAQYGVLTLVWLVVGYFSLFDLGLGRALTKLVAEKLGAGSQEDIPQLVWTGLALMLCFGLLGAAIIGLLSNWLVYVVLKIPQALRSETVDVFYLLSASLPIVISTAGLRGILEAQQKFGFINSARILMGVVTYLGPLVVLMFSKSLFLVVLFLVFWRLLIWFVHLLLCMYTMPELRKNISVSRSLVAPLLKFGGWMTITNIVSPIMNYFDRFFVGALFSVAAVAYYATPYEMITKMWLIPSALSGVLFPAITTSLVKDVDRAAMLFERGVKYLLIVLFPITMIIITFAQEGLRLWLGSEFATHSARVLQLLAVGVFFGGLDQLPFAFIQGAGRPDLTAKLHLSELPAYLLLLWWLGRFYGIEGVAFAWTVQSVFNTVLLFGISRKFMPGKEYLILRMAFAMSASLLLLSVPIFITGIATKALYLVVVLLAFIFVAWFVMLAPVERLRLKAFLRLTPGFEQG